jgi:hypothetical protein
MDLATQLLAERLGISKEEYQAVRAGDPSPIASRFSNPLWGALMASLVQGKAAGTETDQDAGDRDGQLARAKRHIRKLHLEIATRRAIVDRVAQIAGACQVCLGFNAVCPCCGGSGRPGCVESAEDEFFSWIASALEKRKPGRDEPAESLQASSERPEISQKEEL